MMAFPKAEGPTGTSPRLGSVCRQSVEFGQGLDILSVSVLSLESLQKRQHIVTAR